MPYGLPGADSLTALLDSLPSPQARLICSSWPVVASPLLQTPPPPSPPARQADRCRVGGPGAQRRQRALLQSATWRLYNLPSHSSARWSRVLL
eukprot:scaffold77482_cov27-Tisochrysis_lutea.AAC.1